MVIKGNIKKKRIKEGICLVECPNCKHRQQEHNGKRIKNPLAWAFCQNCKFLFIKARHKVAVVKSM